MLVTAGVLVGVAAVVLALVALFRTLISVGISLAVILALVAVGFYFLPDVVGPLASEAVGILDYLIDALAWGFAIFG